METGIEEPLSRALTKLVRPSIALLAQLTDGELPLGSSKLGGWPDLPPGMMWPMRKPYRLVFPRGDRSEMQEERPLAFLAQINLSEIALAGGTDLGLPESGLLSFFYDAETQPWGFDPGDSVGFRLMWVGDTVLQAQEPPKDLNQNFNSVLLSAQTRECLPPPETFAMSRLIEQSVDSKSVRKQLESLFHNKETRERFLTSGHALGGWPSPVQGEMETECQLVTNGIFCGLPEGYTSRKAMRLRPGAADWRLVLQIASDERVGFERGDSGKLYVWMREQDIHARRFDRCWTILQCY